MAVNHPVQNPMSLITTGMLICLPLGAEFPPDAQDDHVVSVKKLGAVECLPADDATPLEVIAMLCVDPGGGFLKAQGEPRRRVEYDAEFGQFFFSQVNVSQCELVTPRMCLLFGTS